MSGPPDESPLFPDLVVRIVALWIFAGAMLKLFLGTPADLPEVLQRLPWGRLTTFRWLVGIETFVGLFGMARPRRAWVGVAAALIAFLAGLVVSVLEGIPSCGCFGARFRVSPAIVLGVDATLLAVLLASRPWRLRVSSFRADAAAGLVASVLAVAAGFQAKAPIAAPDRGLFPETWVGRPLAETPLASWIDVAQATDGLWFLYRDACEVCAECLPNVRERAQGRDVTLVRVGERLEPGVRPAVHALPEGPDIHRFDLPDSEPWAVDTPGEFVVEGGIVVSARPGLTPEDCRTP